MFFFFPRFFGAFSFFTFFFFEMYIDLLITAHLQGKLPIIYIYWSHSMPSTELSTVVLKVKKCKCLSFSPVWLFVIPWIAACQAPLSMEWMLQARAVEWVAILFSRRSFWPGIEPGSPVLLANSLPSEPPGKEIKFVVTSISSS